MACLFRKMMYVDLGMGPKVGFVSGLQIKNIGVWGKILMLLKHLDINAVMTVPHKGLALKLVGLTGYRQGCSVAEPLKKERHT